MNRPYTITEVNTSNVDAHGVFCIKNRQAQGTLDKKSWLKDARNTGVRMYVAEDNTGKQVGFIECLPVENAWRPVQGKDLMYIQCIALFSKKDRNKALGTTLIQKCEAYGRHLGKKGICTVVSKGPWMAGPGIFKKNGYTSVEEKDRFILMFKRFKDTAAQPVFRNWTVRSQALNGWHLVYADQCPWHAKAVSALSEEARNAGIDLRLSRLKSPREAQDAPSGFGTFSLVHDGRILADHYISATRFRTILKAEAKG